MGTMKTRKLPRPKAEAVLVESKGSSYASILKEVREGLAKEDVAFSKVRKTRRGDILLEVDKGQNATQIQSKLEEQCPNLRSRTLKESAKVILRGRHSHTGRTGGSPRKGSERIPNKKVLGEYL